MNIAVVYDQGKVGEHFGYAKQMKIYRVAPTGRVLETKIVDTNCSGHKAMCEFLRSHDVHALICSNIGKEASGLLLLECQVELYAGLQGDPDELIKLYTQGKLEDFQIKFYDQIYGKNASKACDREGCDCDSDCDGDCSSCHEL